VRAHPSLALLEDRLFLLSCSRTALSSGSTLAQVPAAHRGYIVSQLSVTVDGEQRVEAALEGTSYALRAAVTNPDPGKGLLVKNCRAFDGRGGAVELVDDR
jgi:hypothetical protein